MPACDHPDNLVFTTIEEAVGRNNHFAKGKVRELRNKSAGPWISSQAAQHTLHLFPEPKGSLRIVLKYIRYSGKKLSSCRGCKMEFHRGPARQKSICLSQDLIQINPFPPRDFLLAPRQQVQNLALVLAASKASMLSRTAAALPRWVMTTGCCDDFACPATQPPRLSEIGNRNDGPGTLPIDDTSRSTLKDTAVSQGCQRAGEGEGHACQDIQAAAWEGGALVGQEG